MIKEPFRKAERKRIIEVVLSLMQIQRITRRGIRWEDVMNGTSVRQGMKINFVLNRQESTRTLNKDTWHPG